MYLHTYLYFNEYKKQISKAKVSLSSNGSQESLKCLQTTQTKITGTVKFNQELI